MRPVKMTVLVVDDDPRMVDLMEHILELEGYRTVAASGGTVALAAFVRETPDIVLLDVQMPDMDGYSVCRHIRESSTVPVIMVSARDEDQDKIRGLECGADDYVTKPFCVQELTARIKTVLRRTRHSEDNDLPEYRNGVLTVNFVARRVYSQGRDVNLTATEYRLISHLARNAGMILAADQILDRVWGKECRGDYHLLRVNMARLRQKIGDNNKNRQYIITKPGLGYMMAEPAETGPIPIQLCLDVLPV